MAKKKGITFVVQVGSNDKITGEDPNTVMAAVARNVVYHDPSADITDEVIATLNAMYEKRKAQQGGAAAAPPPPPPLRPPPAGSWPATGEAR